MNQDELLARLNGLEWNDFECKRAQRGVPDDSYKTVSAFANTAGGWLVFGISTTQQARAVADQLVRQQLLDQLSETHFQVCEAVRKRFAQEVQAQAKDQAGAKSGPSKDQVGAKSKLSAEQHTVVTQMTDEHDVATLMHWVGRSNRSKFREVVLAPLSLLELVEMTIPDKPNSSRQRYRLTQQGRALRDEVGR